jgi:hypothetical protein
VDGTQVVLYLLYLGLMVFCLLSGLLEKLEKTESMLRERELLADQRRLSSKLASVQVSFDTCFSSRFQ